MLLFLAQLILTLSPQPLDSLHAIADRRGHVAAVKATVCNERQDAITLTGGRLIQRAEASGFAVVDPDLVSATITRQRATLAVQLARTIDVGAPVASAATAAFQSIPTWGKLIAPAVMVVSRLARGRVDQAEATLPGQWIRTDALIALTPGACQSRLMLVRWDGAPRPPVEVQIR